jgi:hypothetical protein
MRCRLFIVLILCHTVAILNIGGMHDGVHQEALRVDENVPLLALDLLARIVAVRVNARPPWTAPRFDRTGSVAR